MQYKYSKLNSQEEARTKQLETHVAVSKKERLWRWSWPDRFENYLHD